MLSSMIQGFASCSATDTSTRPHRPSDLPSIASSERSSRRRRALDRKWAAPQWSWARTETIGGSGRQPTRPRPHLSCHRKARSASASRSSRRALLACEHAGGLCMFRGMHEIARAHRRERVECQPTSSLSREDRQDTLSSHRTRDANDAFATRNCVEASNASKGEPNPCLVVIGSSGSPRDRFQRARNAYA
jgi:hypothetical protein